MTLRMSVGRNDSCFCGSGKKYKKCHSDIFPVSNVANILQGYAEFDSEIESKRTQHNVKFICQKGCSACCRDYFYISIAEYYTIRHYVMVTFPDRLDSIIERAKVLMAELKAFSPQEYEKISAFHERDSMTEESIACFCDCLFLSNNTCSIYPVRPFLCRLYGCITTKSLSCEKIITATAQSGTEKCLVTIESNLPFWANHYEINSRQIVFPEKPIFYWFSRDDIYRRYYLLATGKSKEHFAMHFAKS